MNGSVLLLLLASVALSSSAQVVLKVGVGRDPVAGALAAGEALPMLVSVATSPWIVGGLVCFAASVLLWLAVLARAPLSQAYPCVALGFVLTVAAGHWGFGEDLSVMRGAGLAAILFGVGLVALS